MLRTVGTDSRSRGNSPERSGKRYSSLDALLRSDRAELIPEIFHTELHFPDMQSLGSSRERKEAFYEFVQDYARALEVKLSYETSLATDVLGWDKHNSTASNIFRAGMRILTVGGVAVIGLTTNPLAIPVVAGVALGLGIGITYGRVWGLKNDGTDLRVVSSRFNGLLPLQGDTKLHEYLHVYNALVALDLERNGVTVGNAYSGISEDDRERVLGHTFSSVNYRAPTSDSLLDFERRITRRAKQGLSLTPITGPRT